jgi:hypothetical protein
MHCSFTERCLRTKCFGQIVLLKESITEEGRKNTEPRKALNFYFKTTIVYVIAIVKFVRSHKLQNTFNACPLGFYFMYSNA